MRAPAATERHCSSRACLHRELVQQPGLADPRLSTDDDHARLLSVALHELTEHMPDHSLPADEGAAVSSRVDGRCPAKVAVAVYPVPPRPLQRTAACENLITERDGFRLRREIEFLPQDRLAAVELAYRLVRCSHPRV